MTGTAPTGVVTFLLTDVEGAPRVHVASKVYEVKKSFSGKSLHHLIPKNRPAGSSPSPSRTSRCSPTVLRVAILSYNGID